MKLEIHLRPDSRSMLVRVPNGSIRKKIVDQEIWHIGSSLFYVAQWSSSLAMKSPTFTSILLWAHVRGIPFDLYTQEGLGRVANLLGLIVEVDEYTKRMVNINVAHLKIKADCTKPLPTTVEIERDNGEIVTIYIDYPWTPPICPCCKEMGRLEAMCPNSQWSAKQNKDPPARFSHNTDSANTSTTYVPDPMPSSFVGNYTLSPEVLSVVSAQPTSSDKSYSSSELLPTAPDSVVATSTSVVPAACNDSLIFAHPVKGSTKCYHESITHVIGLHAHAVSGQMSSEHLKRRILIQPFQRGILSYLLPLIFW